MASLKDIDTGKSNKFKKVMKEQSEGKLKTSYGTKPSNKQAVAIAYSEARRAKK